MTLVPSYPSLCACGPRVNLSLHSHTRTRTQTHSNAHLRRADRRWSASSRAARRRAVGSGTGAGASSGSGESARSDSSGSANHREAASARRTIQEHEVGKSTPQSFFGKVCIRLEGPDFFRMTWAFLLSYETVKFVHLQNKVGDDMEDREVSVVEVAAVAELSRRVVQDPLSAA